MNKISILLCFMVVQCKTVFSQSNVEDALSRVLKTQTTFLQMFLTCVEDPTANMQFEMDDIKKFIIFPSKTTVGFAPRYTSNRKFFANLITTPAFKDMLESDKKKLVSSYVKKMKYCDQSIMDPALLNDFYDREVDQNKI